MIDSAGNRPVVYDDSGNLVLGYGPTEGYYRKSSNSTYSRSTKVRTENIEKKTAENAIQYGKVFKSRLCGGVIKESLSGLDDIGVVDGLDNSLGGAGQAFIGYIGKKGVECTFNKFN